MPEKQIIDYYSTSITATVLNVSRVTVYRYIKEGKLHAIKEGGDYYCCQNDLNTFYFKYRVSKETKDEVLKIMRKLRDSVIKEELDTNPHTLQHKYDSIIGD